MKRIKNFTFLAEGAVVETSQLHLLHFPFLPPCFRHYLRPAGDIVCHMSLLHHVGGYRQRVAVAVAYHLAAPPCETHFPVVFRLLVLPVPVVVPPWPFLRFCPFSQDGDSPPGLFGQPLQPFYLCLYLLLMDPERFQVVTLEVIEPRHKFIPHVQLE